MTMDLPKVETVEEVKARVALIRARASEGRSLGDCHEMEDQLYDDVLDAIAGGYLTAKEACELAAAARQTSLIDFPRWFE
jgi:hypothetical protein